MVRPVSIGLFSMYGAVPDLISIDLADALLFAAFAVTWTGARVFESPSARHSAAVLSQTLATALPYDPYPWCALYTNDEGAAAIAVSSPLSSVGQL